MRQGAATERRRLILRQALGYAHCFAALFLLSQLASRGQAEQWLLLPWWAVVLMYYVYLAEDPRTLGPVALGSDDYAAWGASAAR